MSKLRKSARGQDCQVRLPNVCNFSPETTVLAHLSGGGIGGKKSDIHGSFCCSNCHDAIDGRIMTEHSYDYLQLAHREGVERTQDVWLGMGLIRID